MANFNLNKVIIGGRLVVDPELKKTTNDISVLRFTLACNRRYQPKENGDSTPTADFISCVAWRQTAEFIATYFRKGSGLCVVGHIETRSFEDRDHVKHYMTDVVVDEAYFVDSKAEKASAGQTMGYMPAAYSQPQAVDKPVPTVTQTDSFGQLPNFEVLSSEEELPF